MDIGGDDLYFLGKLDRQAPDMVWRMLRVAYPEGNVGDANSDAVQSIQKFSPDLWKLGAELFVYPSVPPIFKDDERPHGFLHVFLNPDGPTFVVDNDPPDPKQRTLVDEIILALTVNQLFVPFPRRTFSQLWEDATARRFVRWHPSKVIERLRVTKKGNAVCAFGPYTADHYIISKRYPDRTFAYELVTPENPGTDAEILAAAKKTQHFTTARKGKKNKGKKEKLLPLPEKT